MDERDRGAAGVEAAFAVTSLLLVGMFAVGALRITNSGGDVHSAARAGARAAAAARSDVARATAHQVVHESLRARGQSCVGGPTVDVARDGVTATVRVSCVVGLGDTEPVGFGDARTVTATAIEFVDPLRGGDG